MATSKKSSGAPTDVIGFMNYYLVDKSPVQLPKGFKDFLVKLAPIVSLILGVLAALGALTVFGIGSLLSPFALLGGGAAVLGSAFIGAGFLAVIAVLYLMAYSGLKTHSMNGWKMLFYVQVLYLVNGLLGLNILNTLVSALISFYFLFQIREYYK